MITLNTIMKRFEDFAANHFFIRSFSFGAPEDVDLQKFDSYPLMHVVYTGASYEDTTKTLDFEIYIFDLPSHYDSKTTRQKEVVSDAEQCAEDILADIANGGNIFVFDEDYEVINANVTPLQETGSNVLAGVLLELGIQIPYDRSACNAPIDGVQPEGGGFVYARRGLLRILTQDASVDVLSVNTIKVANGTLIDEGNGVVSLETGGGGTLEELDDVTITDPLDHDALVYDEVLGEWINGAPKALDMAVYNGSGAIIAKGKLLKAIGSQGDKVSVGLFNILSDAPEYLVGFAEDQMAIGGTGHARTYGELRGINTSAYSIGTILYATTTAGEVSQYPLDEYPRIPVAIVTRSQINTGRIYIRTWVPGQYKRLDTLDDVNVGSRLDGDSLIWSDSQASWIPGGAQAADIKVVNNSTTTDILRGQVVSRTSANAVSLYNSFSFDGREVLGVATSKIDRNGGTGYVRAFGVLRFINTSSLTAGAPIYGGTTPGSITTTFPSGAYKRTIIGFVLTSGTSGSIFIRALNIPSVQSLSDYNGSPASFGQVLAYDGSLWGPRTITTGDVKGGSASPPPGGFKSVFFQDAAGDLSYELEFTYDTSINTLAVDNITTTGTVNGRNMATDGTKLDGIAAGAEVNVNADWNAVSGDAQILNKPTIPSQYSFVATNSTTTYPLVIGDANEFMICDSTSNFTITIPLNSSVPFPTGTEIAFMQYNTGSVTVQGTGGVTLRSSQTAKTAKQYAVIAIKKINTDEWVCVGDRLAL